MICVGKDDTHRFGKCHLPAAASHCYLHLLFDSALPLLGLSLMIPE
jgi:hypothetical protein